MHPSLTSDMPRQLPAAWHPRPYPALARPHLGCRHPRQRAVVLQRLMRLGRLGLKHLRCQAGAGAAGGGGAE